MKYLMVILVAVIFFVTGCGKDNTPGCTAVTKTAPADEITALKTYIDTNHITVLQDARGFFFSIDSSASTVAGHPTICSDVSVTYTGRFLNRQVFDSTGDDTPISFNLSGVIIGWQEALPLMKANSVITLYLPPSLAYGASGYKSVPPNAYLIFSIRLLAFN